MIARYTRDVMARIWSPENRYQKWLDIELLVCEAMAELGRIPQESLKIIKEKASFDVARIDEIEKTTKHDVIAFITCVQERVGPEGRFIHLGLTSSDILDTAFAVLLRDASDVLLKDVETLLSVLKRRALEHKSTVMMGRTHGVHAEPITFGLKMALWYKEMERNYERLKRAKDNIAVGKITGAVGTYSTVDPFVERYVCAKLGLKAESISSQIVPRDRHAEYFCVLAIIASSLDKFAQEIRLLQRTEVREAEEPFTSGQKGSSAMPHKRNPILSENISGLSRMIRSYAIAALENVPLWHERDISHSSVERVIGPDATTLLDFMLYRFTDLMDKLVVYPDNMLKNLHLTGGVIYSQLVMLKLIEKGMSREDAYVITQHHAMNAWQRHSSFKELLSSDERVRSILTEEELDSIFQPENFLHNLDYIFERVFG
ncbi:MAG: adenylosuccinate lyase [Syntrophales bacterium]|nr:adenylosuccinate lyase [Syntrophales bacterium]